MGARRQINAKAPRRVRSHIRCSSRLAGKMDLRAWQQPTGFIEDHALHMHRRRLAVGVRRIRRSIAYGWNRIGERRRDKECRQRGTKHETERSQSTTGRIHEHYGLPEESQ